MTKREHRHLNGKIKKLQRTMNALADDDDYDEFLLTIRRPGWTTPAELKLTQALVDALQTQAEAMAELKQSLLAGSRAVAAE